ncbi:FAD-binding oxidoreductase [Marinobacterium jannaschii]|uniref:FAD-binding oxidoreductase n=1 Tax=Marinobacterium jannaschii TaxID=64970 RepID=UPI0004831942|nr:FAD-linked oxidase C-terminal domain-containing protein [Marinobacterium jannaschii]
MARRKYTQADLREVVSELAPGWGDRIRLSADAGRGRGPGPDLVVCPFSNEEVVQVVRLCARHSIPLVPHSSGIPAQASDPVVHGGVCIDLSEMNRVLEINAKDNDCRVQAGVSAEQLNLDLRYDNLFFPLSTEPGATLGGMASSRASGTNSMRYGTMRSMVIGLTVVTASGEIIRVGGRTRKSATGYDLTALFVGAEGTLGIVTEVQVRLFQRPEQTRTAVCSFETLDDAVNAVMVADRRGISMSRVELLDRLQMQASIRHSKLSGLSEAPTLFLEFQGREADVTEQVIAFTDVLAEFNGSNFQWTTGDAESDALWRARHDAWSAAQMLQKAAATLTIDICVPVSRLADALLHAQTRADESGLLCPIVGHVGDGSFHMLILFEGSDARQQQLARSLAEAIVGKALSLEGTCSGDQELGAGKKHYLSPAQSGALETMKSVKRALDPDNIMNPGNLLEI